MKRTLKLIFIIFLVLFITGCTATYNMTIDGEQVRDSLTVNSNFTSNQIKAYTQNAVPVNMNIGCFLDYDQDDVEDATKKKSEINYYEITSKNHSNLNATSASSIKEYKNSRIANSLFNNININNYDNKISIFGFNGLSAFISNLELEKVTVNITVKNKKVTVNDADKVKDNTYTWYFDKNTDDNKTLYLEMENIIKEETTKKSYSSYIILAIFAISLIALIIVKIKDIKN